MKKQKMAPRPNKRVTVANKSRQKTSDAGGREKN